MTDDYKLPPSNAEAEQAVIGAITLDAQSDRVQRVFSFLAPEMFYNRRHGMIYKVVRSMNAAIHVEQRNGIIYEVDQEQAARKSKDREDKPRKKGGF